MALNLDARIPDGPIDSKWDNHKFSMKLVAPHNKRRFEIIVVGTGLAGAAAAATLGGLGYKVLDAQSTYFLCVDLAASGIALDDEAFAKLAVEQAGVAVVPLSAFAEQDPPTHLVRLCFGKKDETIEAGVAAMAKAKELAR